MKLQRGDSAARLQALGIPVHSKVADVESGSATARRRPACFYQPCPAHDGSRCRIYEDRPQYCREFECALLKQVKLGEVSEAEAQRVIAATKKRAEEVRTLLRELGDTEEGLALSKRFRRTSSRFEEIGFDEATADVYGSLTLAVHDLNFALHDQFYPPPG